MLTYKVIELTTVTEETIEQALNEWTARGWNLNGMQFAMHESSAGHPWPLSSLHGTRETAPMSDDSTSTWLTALPISTGPTTPSATSPPLPATRPMPSTVSSRCCSSCSRTITHNTWR